MSFRDLFSTLAGIQETVLLSPGERGQPRAQRLLTDTDPTQRLFNLDARAPPLTWVIHAPRADSPPDLGKHLQEEVAGKLPLSRWSRAGYVRSQPLGRGFHRRPQRRPRRRGDLPAVRVVVAGMAGQGDALGPRCRLQAFRRPQDLIELKGGHGAPHPLVGRFTTVAAST